MTEICHTPWYLSTLGADRPPLPAGPFLTYNPHLGPDAEPAIPFILKGETRWR